MKNITKREQNAMGKKKTDKFVLLARSDAYQAVKAGTWNMRPKHKYYRPDKKRELREAVLAGY